MIDWPFALARAAANQALASRPAHCDCPVCREAEVVLAEAAVREIRAREAESRERWKLDRRQLHEPMDL